MLRKLSIMLLVIVVFSIPSLAMAQGGTTITVWFTGDEQQAAALQVAADAWGEQTGQHGCHRGGVLE